MTQELLKFCRDCRWCDKFDSWFYAKCKSPRNISTSVDANFLVKGDGKTKKKVRFFYCDTHREYSADVGEGICGREGIFWEKKPPSVLQHMLRYFTPPTSGGER